MQVASQCFFTWENSNYKLKSLCKQDQDIS
jgi:hypothetical protein